MCGNVLGDGGREREVRGDLGWPGVSGRIGVGRVLWHASGVCGRNGCRSVERGEHTITSSLVAVVWCGDGRRCGGCFPPRSNCTRSRHPKQHGTRLDDTVASRGFL